MTPLLDALHSGRVLLMDGAMGTALQRSGLKAGDNAAAWNRTHPERVEAVHRAYVAAGADVLLTNTFLINLLHEPAEIAWQTAFVRMRNAPVYCLAAVGPVAGEVTEREFGDWDRFFIPDRCLVDHTVCRHWPHGILLETCSSPRVRFAMHRLREGQVPLLLSLSYRREAGGQIRTASGHSPEWFARRARAYGAQALGVNCGVNIGMGESIEILRRYREETDVPLFARPNAGTPVRRAGTWVYPQSPEGMAERLPELIEAGASMVGGCCGTSPEHVAAFRKVVDSWNSRLDESGRNAL